MYAAQGNPKIDAEIAEKRRFRTGTSQDTNFQALLDQSP